MQLGLAPSPALKCVCKGLHGTCLLKDWLPGLEVLSAPLTLAQRCIALVYLNPFLPVTITTAICRQQSRCHFGGKPGLGDIFSLPPIACTPPCL